MRGLKRLGLLVALMVLGVPTSAEAGTSACKLAGSKTIVKTTTARVFQKKGRLRLQDGSLAVGSRVYGCRAKTNKRFLLGLQKPVDGESEWIDPKVVRLAGPFVGYARGFDSGLDGGQFVEVRDLRTGNRVYRTDNNNLVKVFDLELSAGGSVAWISNDQLESTTNPGVWAWGAAAGRMLLDSGQGVSARSLTLSGTTLSWLKAGVQRSAPVPA